MRLYWACGRRAKDHSVLVQCIKKRCQVVMQSCIDFIATHFMSRMKKRQMIVEMHRTSAYISSRSCSFCTSASTKALVSSGADLADNKPTEKRVTNDWLPPRTSHANQLRTAPTLTPQGETKLYTEVPVSVPWKMGCTVQLSVPVNKSLCSPRVAKRKSAILNTITAAVGASKEYSTHLSWITGKSTLELEGTLIWPNSGISVRSHSPSASKSTPWTSGKLNKIGGVPKASGSIWECGRR